MYRKACEEMSAQFVSVVTLKEQSETVKEEKKNKAEELTVPQAIHACEEFQQQYGGLKRNLRYAQFRQAMDKVLAYCVSEDIDPEIFLKAQYAALGKWLGAQRKPLFPGIFTSEKAADRYREFLRDTPGLFENVREDPRDATDYDDTFLAECLFGELLLVGHKPDAAAKEVRKVYSKWKRPTYATPRALVQVLDRVRPGLSRQCGTLEGDKIRWTDAVEFVNSLTRGQHDN